MKDVVKTSGVPTHTFVAPSEFRGLSVARRTAGRGLVVRGPSGLAKTFAVTRAHEQIGMTDSAQVLDGSVALG